MTGKPAIDFGTSSTRVAVWDPVTEQAHMVSIPDVSVFMKHDGADGETIESPCVPSLIHYAGKQILIGRQVRDNGLTEAPSTFRWMKRYISNRLEIPRKIDGRSVTTSQAGSDFLLRVLIYMGEAVSYGDEEVVLTLPVEAFEHYQEWLSRVCEEAGIVRYRFLDEASAAALGYALQVKAGSVFMVFDFGGGTLDVSIVRMEHEATGAKRCSVLGKGGAEVGGATIDNWLYRDLLAKNNRHAEDVTHMSNSALMEIEAAKERLSSADRAEVTVADPRTGEVLYADYSRSRFEDILEENGLFETLQEAVNRALSDARERGHDADSVEQVLLVGGSSLIPSVRRAVRQTFGARVRSHRPLDAVVLGAASFAGGVSFFDHIQHDYALRYYNREKGEHDYLLIVPAGTAYPTNGHIREVVVSGSYDEQEYLGLDIYEISRKGPETGAPGCGFELVFDPSGSARFQKREDYGSKSRFWVNEQRPTFIHAEPTANRGDKRFPVQFSVDESKRLCVTVTDRRTGKTLMKSRPLIKLI